MRGGGQISPDAKYLAYADRLGIHVQVIETGETNTIPQPEGFDAKNSYWSIGAWFPSSKEFLVTSRPAAEDAKQWTAEGASIWTVSLTGRPRKIRENAEAWSVSQDGAWIAFGARAGKMGDREIWLMGPNGERPHKVFETSEERMIAVLRWSQDGRHVIYGDCDKDICTILSRELTSSPPIEVSSGPAEQVISFLWLGDGRLLYIVPEPGPSVANCNLWQQRVDPRNGHPSDRPARLTNWAGFCLDSLSATVDSKHVAFTRWASQTNILIGDLASAGSKGFAPAPLMMREGWNTFLDWTRDSKAVLFTSDRNGKWQIFRQSIGADNARPVISPPSWLVPTEGFFTGIAGGALGAQTSPDGRWVLYFANPDAHSVVLMRVPIEGGANERVTPASIGATLGCSKVTGRSCVIAERSPEQNEIVFSALNPLTGRGHELVRIAAGPEPHPWALSQDGSSIAVHAERSNHFDLLSTATGRPEFVGTTRLVGCRTSLVERQRQWPVRLRSQRSRRSHRLHRTEWPNTCSLAANRRFRSYCRTFSRFAASRCHTLA